jgi:CubicO group peptidase (beta-lactamase class C family)
MKIFTALTFVLTLAAAIIDSAAQEITIRSAIEVSHPTQTGFGYRLFSSGNLGAWEPEGTQVFGDGTESSALFPSREQGTFYKMEQFPVRNLDAIMEEIRAARNVPALSCVVVISNRIVGLGSAGARKWNVTGAPAFATDKWHHGSLTKSFTATLAAMMVEDGLIQWTNTLADIFPTLKNGMHSGWHNATLEQLTSNRGGAPEAPTSALWNELWNFPGTPEQARRLLLTRLTATAPASTPGTQYAYSNTGFSLAGHMLETVAGKSWEDLTRERIFIPLGMTTAGFGVPATPRHIDHPWGHTLPTPGTASGPGNLPRPSEPGTSADNPPAVGPGGTMHCSPIDFGKYLAFHIEAHKGRSKLLSREGAIKLHTAYANNANYAHGWIALDRPWGGGEQVLTHTGSNTQWFSTTWIAPGREFGVLGACNLGGTTASAATGDIVTRMITEFLN